MKKSGVYVLQLTNTDKFYVGKSVNIENRIGNHKECGDKCAKYVKMNGGVYKALQPLTPPDDNLSNWEKDETLVRMIKHGFNNVRGWEFTNITKLDTIELEMIKKSIMGLGDRCRNCGNNGHFADGCSTEKAQWLKNLENCYSNKVNHKTSVDVLNNLLDEKPLKKIETPLKTIETPLKTIETPLKTIETPLKTIEEQPSIIIERAKTGKAKCQTCKELILKDEYRIGEPYEFRGKPSTKWFHQRCHSSNIYKTEKLIPEVSAISQQSNKEPNIIKEIATTGRAKCQKCNQLITKGEYRIGTEYTFNGKSSIKWIHEVCNIIRSIPKTTKKINKCDRCGRKGHSYEDCYAETDVNGFELSDDEEEECCFRCGRDGHYANECYAKKNIDGFYIRD